MLVANRTNTKYILIGKVINIKPIVVWNKACSDTLDLRENHIYALNHTVAMIARKQIRRVILNCFLETLH